MAKYKELKERVKELEAQVRDLKKQNSMLQFENRHYQNMKPHNHKPMNEEEEELRKLIEDNLSISIRTEGNKVSILANYEDKYIANTFDVSELPPNIHPIELKRQAKTEFVERILHEVMAIKREKKAKAQDYTHYYGSLRDIEYNYLESMPPEEVDKLYGEWKVATDEYLVKKPVATDASVRKYIDTSDNIKVNVNKVDTKVLSSELLEEAKNISKTIKAPRLKRCAGYTAEELNKVESESKKEKKPSRYQQFIDNYKWR